MAWVCASVRVEPLSTCFFLHLSPPMVLSQQKKNKVNITEKTKQPKNDKCKYETNEWKVGIWSDEVAKVDPKSGRKVLWKEETARNFHVNLIVGFMHTRFGRLFYYLFVSHFLLSFSSSMLVLLWPWRCHSRKWNKWTARWCLQHFTSVHSLHFLWRARSFRFDKHRFGGNVASVFVSRRKINYFIIFCRFK